MRPEKHNSRRAISPPKSTTQLPSATTHPNVDAIQRVERGSELGWRAQLAVPLAALVALAIHLLFSKRAPAVETHSYTLLDRKSTRLNSSHRCSSYAVFCL